MRRALFATLTLPLLLAGCAVGPEYEQPQVDLPEEWPDEVLLSDDERRTGRTGGSGLMTPLWTGWLNGHWTETSTCSCSTSGCRRPGTARACGCREDAHP